MGSELVSESKKGQVRHIQLLCEDNHINKMDFISVHFVTVKGTLPYVGRIEGTDGTGYYVLIPDDTVTMKFTFQMNDGIRFTLKNDTVKKLPLPMQEDNKTLDTFHGLPSSYH